MAQIVEYYKVLSLSKVIFIAWALFSHKGLCFTSQQYYIAKYFVTISHCQLYYFEGPLWSCTLNSHYIDV